MRFWVVAVTSAVMAAFMLPTVGTGQVVAPALASGLDSFASVTGFTLVDSDTDADILPLTDGDVLNVALLERKLNIRADIGGGPVGSVRFGFDDDPSFRVENFAPYSLGGDHPIGDYLGLVLTPGRHVITATPFTDGDAQGAAQEPLTITFHIGEPGADPRCTIIESTTLTADIVDCGGGLTIAADDVVLDGNGFSLVADGPGTGITIDGRRNVRIKNLNIVDFFSGAIRVVDSRRVRIVNVRLDLPTGTASFGISVEGSYSITIRGSDLGRANGTNLLISDSSLDRVRRSQIGGGGNYQVQIMDSAGIVFVANSIDPGDNVFPMVALSNVDWSRFAENTLSDEFVTGFDVDEESVGNRFVRNATMGTGFVDGSRGEGTAGTANRYRGNVCPDTETTPGGSTPEGLCEVQPAHTP